MGHRQTHNYRNSWNLGTKQKNQRIEKNFEFLDVIPFTMFTNAFIKSSRININKVQL